MTESYTDVWLLALGRVIKNRKNDIEEEEEEGG